MLAIVLILWGIGKKRAMEGDALKGLTEPADATSSQHNGEDSAGATQDPSEHSCVALFRFPFLKCVNA